MKGLLLFALLTQAIDWGGVITEFTVLSSGTISTYIDSTFSLCPTAPAGEGVRITYVAGQLKVWHNGLQVAAFGSAGILEDGHYIEMHNNCFLIIWDKFGNFVWFSSLSTGGTRTGCSLRAQSDGNLVIYDDSGWAQWVASTILLDCAACLCSQPNGADHTYNCLDGVSGSCGSQICYATSWFLKLQPENGCASTSSSSSRTPSRSPSTPSPSPSASRSSSSSLSPSASLSSSSSSSPPASVTSSSSPSPTPTSTISSSSPSPSSSSSSSPSPSPTSTVSPSDSPTGSPSSSPSPPASLSSSESPSPSPTSTVSASSPSPSPTSTVSPADSPTGSPSSSLSPPASLSSSSSPFPSPTRSRSSPPTDPAAVTATASITPQSVSASAIGTATAPITPSSSTSALVTPALTASKSSSSTVTLSPTPSRSNLPLCADHDNDCTACLAMSTESPASTTGPSCIYCHTGPRMDQCKPLSTQLTNLTIAQVVLFYNTEWDLEGTSNATTLNFPFWQGKPDDLCFYLQTSSSMRGAHSALSFALAVSMTVTFLHAQLGQQHSSVSLFI